MNILIVEDDAAINNLLAEILRHEDYVPIQSFSGTEARMVLNLQQISLVLLDLMLPGLTGEELVPLIRAKGNIPILVLSARDSVRDKAMLLRAGADDYITKPFDEEELLARIEALIRRTFHRTQVTMLRYKDIEIDQDARTVRKGDAQIILTAREFDILNLLMGNPHKVFTKGNLYQSVWNDEFMGDDNTINVHMSNLRSKLGSGDYIQTIWGIGFKLYDPSGL